MEKHDDPSVVHYCRSAWKQKFSMNDFKTSLLRRETTSYLMGAKSDFRLPAQDVFCEGLNGRCLARLK